MNTTNWRKNESYYQFMEREAKESGYPMEYYMPNLENDVGHRIAQETRKFEEAEAAKKQKET